MRDKFICKGCSSTLGFATSFDVDEVVGIFYNSLKSMKYHNNKNMFKDFYFPFMSPTKFAVKVRQNQR